MIIKPIIPKEILKQPYYKGIISGTIIGFGLSWTVINVINKQYIDIIISIMVFTLGYVRYIVETKADDNFI